MEASWKRRGAAERSNARSLKAEGLYVNEHAH